MATSRNDTSVLEGIVSALILCILEAPGEYYYEEVEVKRWILGGGGVSGNCEICDGNAELGWIDMDDVFDGVDGDVDEPPGHINCGCTAEFKTKRERVYV